MIKDYIVQLLLIMVGFLEILMSYCSKNGKINYIVGGYLSDDMLKNNEYRKIIMSHYFKITIILSPIFILINASIIFLKYFYLKNSIYIVLIDVLCIFYLFFNVFITIIYLNIIDRKL